MNLVTMVPIALLFLLGLAVFAPDGKRGLRVLFLMLAVVGVVSIVIKSIVLGKVKPEPLSRPGVAATAANTLSYGIIYAVLIAMDWLHRH
jgi:hypothetical protein